jgi:predicted TPR repeat methyltransferase
VASTTDLSVTFPSTSDGRLSQDREWCRVIVDGEQRTIRFHDYDEIYAIPGLYERIFYEHLECRSPAEVVGLLGERLREAGEDPAELSAIDVGAGNGIVGEELRRLGARALVGVDIIPEAAEAAARDRPDVYDDYLVCDLTRLGAADRERLSAERPNCMTTVAALGFDDMPPRAFEQAFELVAPDGWVAFNIKADFLDGGDDTGFRQLIASMVNSGELEVCARRRYRHRLSMQGEPLDYVAVVGRKRTRARFGRGRGGA